MESLLYEKLPEHKVRCKVCNHYCVISNDNRGLCGVRENKDGILYSLNYGKTIATSIDPIEKKPLNHYMPNTYTYSFASVGCNMSCPWCQNSSISQSPKHGNEIDGIYISPKAHIKNALENKCPSISYTYSEPTIFVEYALEIMKLAKQKNIKNIWVTNGYMSKETLQLILPYVDALNIDYKGTKEIYNKYNLGDNTKILENLKTLQEHNIHIEVTTLLIPDINPHNFTQIAKDLKQYVTLDTPWHISRYFPSYKMKETNVTKKELMQKLYQIAKDTGFKNIYLGNI